LVEKKAIRKEFGVFFWKSQHPTEGKKKTEGEQQPFFPGETFFFGQFFFPPGGVEWKRGGTKKGFLGEHHPSTKTKKKRGDVMDNRSTNGNEKKGKRLKKKKVFHITLKNTPNAPGTTFKQPNRGEMEDGYWFPLRQSLKGRRGGL